MSTNISIIGAGRLAEVIATILGKSGARLHLWARNSDKASAIAGKIPAIQVHPSISDAVRSSQLIVLAVPTGAVSPVSEAMGAAVTGDQILLHACRGVARDGERRFVLPHELIRARTCLRKIAALGGPLHARELHLGRPLAAVVASRFLEPQELLKRVLQGTQVKIHATRDLVGVEIAGALANVGVIAQGLVEGLELGETARGEVALRGLIEAQKIGKLFGADPATFGGLAGVGELVPRRTSSLDRHLALGLELAKGKALAGALAESSPESVEGIASAYEARALGQNRHLKLPLVETVAGILDGDAPKPAMSKLLSLDLEGLAFSRGS